MFLFIDFFLNITGHHNTFHCLKHTSKMLCSINQKIDYPNTYKTKFSVCL